MKAKATVKEAVITFTGPAENSTSFFQNWNGEYTRWNHTQKAGVQYQKG